MGNNVILRNMKWICPYSIFFFYRKRVCLLLINFSKRPVHLLTEIYQQPKLYLPFSHFNSMKCSTNVFFQFFFYQKQLKNALCFSLVLKIILWFTSVVTLTFNFQVEFRKYAAYCSSGITVKHRCRHLDTIVCVCVCDILYATTSEVYAHLSVSLCLYKVYCKCFECYLVPYLLGLQKNVAFSHPRLLLSIVLTLSFLVSGFLVFKRKEV